MASIAIPNGLDGIPVDPFADEVSNPKANREADNEAPQHEGGKGLTTPVIRIHRLKGHKIERQSPHDDSAHRTQRNTISPDTSVELVPLHLLGHSPLLGYRQIQQGFVGTRGTHAVGLWLVIRFVARGAEVTFVSNDLPHIFWLR